MSESWRDLMRPVTDVEPSIDLLQRIHEREAALPVGKPRRFRVPRLAGWVMAGVGCLLVLAVLAVAAHSRGNASRPARAAAERGIVVLTAQQGRWAGNHVSDWVTHRRVKLTCPAVESAHTGQPADLCAALDYYAHHSTQSRCSYASIIGPLAAPRRVLIVGSIGGRAVRLDMGMLCNPPVHLASASGAIYQAGFATPKEPALSDATRRRLTAAAKRQAQSLGDPDVHTAQAVLTTEGQMNKAFGFGRQPQEHPHARVYVIQLRGTFTCEECSHPSGASSPTGNAAQDVLAYDSFSVTDFGLTADPVSMRAMGTVIRLFW